LIKVKPFEVALRGQRMLWVLAAFHAVILIVLNHNLFRPGLVRGSLEFSI
jgi:hypothetical protein